MIRPEMTCFKQNMKSPFGQKSRFYTSLKVAAALAVATASALAQPGVSPETVYIRTTNWTSQYVTNVIKVSLPTNVFYNEFQTNWIRQKITNVVDVFRTNFMTEFRTNLLRVDNLKTNYITVYQTNLITSYQTNLIAAYHTNLKTLSFTNWQNVLVMKTNWITTSVTNTVEIDLPKPTAAAHASAPAPAAVKSQFSTPTPAPAALASEGLEFELTQIGKGPKADQIAIKLTLQDVNGVQPVQEWRIEKGAGGGLSLGSRPEFTATLSAGTYKVFARVRSSDGSLRSFRGQIEVKPDASVQRSVASTSIAAR